MLEIEIKAYCDNPGHIEKKILSLGGTLFKKGSERDIYFKHPSRDFAETDEAFRIRLEDNKNVLTYKGPKIGTKTKTRIEKEVEFTDPDSMKDILNRLGFGIVEEVNKTRTIYKINDIDICVDNVQSLGTFVELETKGMDYLQKEKELFKIADELGLSKFETRSYLELILGKK